MKRNSGIIGLKKLPEKTGTSGLYDSFDAYNARKSDIWPRSVSYTITNPSSTITVNQGSTINFEITTTGVPNGEILYYTFTSPSDSSTFTDSSNIGQFTINSSGIGTFSKTLAVTGVTSSITFSGNIRVIGYSGTIVAVFPDINIRATSWTITPNASSINEGGSVFFTVGRTNVDGTNTVYYSISGTNITTNDFDVPSGSLTGSFSSVDSSSGFTVTAKNDAFTEGAESFTASVRALSTSGTILATSSSVGINDTSITVSATVTPNTSSINEGSTVTFTVNTTGFPSGTLYWSINVISGTVNSSDFTVGSTTGSFSVSSSSGSVALTLTNDTTTEGSEQFQLQVRSGSTSGTVIGTSSTVTINDTSTTPSGGTLTVLGGTVLTPGNGFRYNVFTEPGFITTSGSGSITGTIFLLGGGGGGGGPSTAPRQGGGGGGGQSFTQPWTFQVGDNLPVVIGSGGAGNAGLGNGTNGGSTVFGPFYSAVGGGGGGVGPGGNGNPSAGGGGGGAGNNPAGGGGTNTLSPLGRGGNGSGPSISGGAGGGGGGGGAPDSPPTINGTNGAPPRRGGNGGVGSLYPQFPHSIISPAIPAPEQPLFDNASANGGLTTAWGGGGGGEDYNGVNGLGGAGGGAYQVLPGTNFMGGGGGGGGGPGGSGIFIVRTPV